MRSDEMANQSTIWELLNRGLDLHLCIEVVVLVLFLTLRALCQTVLRLNLKMIILNVIFFLQKVKKRIVVLYIFQLSLEGSLKCINFTKVLAKQNIFLNFCKKSQFHKIYDPIPSMKKSPPHSLSRAINYHVNPEKKIKLYTNRFWWIQFIAV